jgi:hypothetical protein
MKVIHSFPPNYDRITEIFPSVKMEHTVIFTYGDTIYDPYPDTTREIQDHEEIHEAKHSEQQGNDPEGWWNRYLTDRDFRTQQEVEAYHSQYEFVKASYGKGIANGLLFLLAKALMHPVYDTQLTYQQAERSIKKGKIRK